MSKRFRDTDVWKKAWFRKLTPVDKCAWTYVCDSCDSVGVWDADYEAGDFFIGSGVDWNGLASRCNGNIHILPSGKWWLVDFVSFQYGELNPECRPHRSYIEALKKHGLADAAKGYRKGIQTHKEKEKEKEQDKEQEKEKDKERSVAPVDPLYRQTWDMMLAANGGSFAAYGKEGKACKELCALARERSKVNGHTPEETMAAVLNQYAMNIRSGDKFWSKQPPTPSALLGLWDRVIASGRKPVASAGAMRAAMEEDP